MTPEEQAKALLDYLSFAPTDKWELNILATICEARKQALEEAAKFVEENYEEPFTNIVGNQSWRERGPNKLAAAIRAQGGPTKWESADELERLKTVIGEWRTKCADLEAENAKLRELVYTPDDEKTWKEVAAIQLENLANLRQALEKIAEYKTPIEFSTAAHYARAALQKETDQRGARPLL